MLNNDLKDSNKMNLKPKVHLLQCKNQSLAYKGTHAADFANFTVVSTRWLFSSCSICFGAVVPALLIHLCLGNVCHM